MIQFIFLILTREPYSGSFRLHPCVSVITIAAGEVSWQYGERRADDVRDVRSRLAGDERPRHLNAHERHLRRQADHVRNFVLNLRLTCLGVLALSVEGLTGNRFTFTGISYYILVEFTESFTKSV